MHQYVTYSSKTTNQTKPNQITTVSNQFGHHPHLFSRQNHNHHTTTSLLILFPTLALAPAPPSSSNSNWFRSYRRSGKIWLLGDDGVSWRWFFSLGFLFRRLGSGSFLCGWLSSCGLLDLGFFLGGFGFGFSCWFGGSFLLCFLRGWFSSCGFFGLSFLCGRLGGGRFFSLGFFGCGFSCCGFFNLGFFLWRFWLSGWLFGSWLSSSWLLGLGFLFWRLDFWLSWCWSGGFLRLLRLSGRGSGLLDLLFCCCWFGLFSSV